MRMKPSLSHDEAQTIANGCLAAAEQHGVAVCIVVVDEAGGLLCAHRMDGARQYTVDLAIQKARAAANVGVLTSALEQLSRMRAGSGLANSVGAGGGPVLHDGMCAGAVGVSGAQPDMDETIALAGVGALIQ